MMKNDTLWTVTWGCNTLKKWTWHMKIWFEKRWNWYSTTKKNNIFDNVYESKSTQASENLYLNFH